MTARCRSRYRARRRRRRRRLAAWEAAGRIAVRAAQLDDVAALLESIQGRAPRDTPEERGARGLAGGAALARPWRAPGAVQGAGRAKTEGALNQLTFLQRQFAAVARPLVLSLRRCWR